MDDAPTFLSGCSGVGGFDLALEREGFVCAGQIEIDPFCVRVLAKRFPGVERRGDMRSAGVESQGPGRRSTAGTGRESEPPSSERRIEQKLSSVDLLVGGFPCQGASIAGKRRGLADDRTALFWEFCRLADEGTFPWVLLENVPGLRSVGLGHDFATVLAALAQRWPLVVWRSLDSRYFDVAQRRERVFFVGGPDSERTAEVLLEPEGGERNLAASGEAGARVAGSATLRAHKASEDDVDLVVSTAIQERYAKGVDSDCTQTLVIGALTGNKDKGGWRAGADEAAAGHLIPFDTTQVTSKGNYSAPKPGDPVHPLAGSAHPPAIAYQQHGTNVGPMGALRKGDGGVTSGVPFVTQQLVRRLTALETERLQAFPDGWTCLCGATEAILAERGIPEAVWRASDWRTIRLDEHVWRCTCPDGPRYRAMGNAVTVTVVTWIARRLRRAMR